MQKVKKRKIMNADMISSTTGTTQVAVAAPLSDYRFDAPGDADVSWYKREKVIHGLGISLIVVGSAAAAATIAAVVLLSGIPAAVITVGVVGGAVSLAMLITGIALRVKSEFWQDPEYRTRRGLEMVSIAMDEGLSYPDFRRRFVADIDHAIEDRHYNMLYGADVQTLTYGAIFDRHGQHLIGRLDEPNKQVLREKFLAFLDTNRDPARQIQNIHGAAMRALNVSNEELASHLLLQQMDALQAQNLTYRQFCANNGHDIVVTFLHLNARIRPVLRDAFMMMGWQELTSDAFASDRTMLGISLEDIHARVRRDLDMDYFSFRAKHGNQPLVESVIQRDEFPEEWQGQLVREVARRDAAFVVEHAADLQLYEIDYRETLCRRWQQTPISEIYQQDRREFCAIYLNIEECRTDARQRLLAEIATSGWDMKQLITFTEFWDRRIITPADEIVEGVTIQSCFDQEIASISSIVQLVERYGAIAIRHGLFDTQHVRKLVVRAFRDAGLRSLPTELSSIFERFPVLIPDEVRRLHQDSVRELSALTNQKDQIIQTQDALFQQNTEYHRRQDALNMRNIDAPYNILRSQKSDLQVRHGRAGFEFQVNGTPLARENAMRLELELRVLNQRMDLERIRRNNGRNLQQQHLNSMVMQHTEARNQATREAHALYAAGKLSLEQQFVRRLDAL